MFKKIQLILTIFIVLNFYNLSTAGENFFKEAKKKYGSSYEITAKKLQKNEILKILKLPSTKSFIIDKIFIPKFVNG